MQKTIISLPKSTPDWVYEGADNTLFLDASGFNTNNAPKDIHDNIVYLRHQLENLYDAISTAYDYNSGSTYNTRDIVSDPVSGAIYISRLDNNVSNALTNATYWKLSNLATINDNVSGTNTVYSSLKLSAVVGALTDAATISGYSPSVAATPDTVAVRDVNGDILGISSSYSGQFDVVKTSPTANMTVTLTPGNIQLGTELITKISQISPTIIAPVADPRLDRIVMSPLNGDIEVLSGVEATVPEAPLIPENRIALAQLILTVGMTQITSTNIIKEYADHSLYLSNTVRKVLADIAVRKWSTSFLPSDFIPSRLIVSLSHSSDNGITVGLTNDSSGVRVVTSDNLKTWVTRSSPAVPEYLNDVTYSKDLQLFCAVGYSYTSGSNIVTSTDGITWTARSKVNNNSWQDIIWVSELSLFIAVSGNGTQDRVMTSTDGITWTVRVTPIQEQSYTSITWSPKLKLLCAVAESGNNRVMTSPDGITWTIRTANTGSWMAVEWSEELGMFLAISRDNSSLSGDLTMYSYDGINWVINNSIGTGYRQSLAWSKELGIFLTVNRHSIVNTIEYHSIGNYSFDGINWFSINQEENNGNYRDVIWIPELRKFVAAGSGSDYLTSPILVSN